MRTDAMEGYSVQKIAKLTAERDLPLLLDMERTRYELGGVSERHVYNLVNRGLLEKADDVGRLFRVTSASVVKLATGRK
jgi:hypothetical protein